MMNYRIVKYKESDKFYVQKLNWRNKWITINDFHVKENAITFIVRFNSDFGTIEKIN